MSEQRFILQNNGSAERMTRTLVEMNHTILRHTCILKMLLGDVGVTTPTLQVKLNPEVFKKKYFF